MSAEIRPAAKAGFNIRLPQQKPGAAQNEEWFEFDLNGRSERMRLHDYAGIFRVPGLYEALVYEKLGCKSPYRLSSLLARIAREEDIEPDQLRILDLGAGNGMVAEELQEVGVRKFVGLDLISEAAEAAERDRPRLYSDYVVGDVRDLSPGQAAAIEKAGPNCLVTVAALGFGDIPPSAFASALNQISPRGWLGMTIKDEFLDAKSGGFGQLLERLMAEGVLEIRARERYCHRLSVAGDPIFYIALVARKLAHVPDTMVAELCRMDGIGNADDAMSEVKYGT